MDILSSLSPPVTLVLSHLSGSSPTLDRSISLRSSLDFSTSLERASSQTARRIPGVNTILIVLFGQAG